ncbi:type VII secretion protein EccCa [Mycolicibacterium sp. J2]|uniref:type VII secretion protein EccCa n=1 Tax=Mycolicibacterium sp. J2 TaxID=2993511 RepID=UPI00224A8F15|nr:type VII secretion protein EccCa [Mycolicibacterium sp. J2]MCX2715622.1 type VII secretion protein EccCa [Mycolicibacterium sp. J2]
MKQGFVRPKPTPPPGSDLKPEPIKLLTPLKVPPPEGKSPWLIVVGILVIGLVVGMVAVSFASGARTFNGVGAIFPVFSILGIGAMLFGGRFSGGGQQMSRGKLDAMRARFLLVLDEMRDRVSDSADKLDGNYRWYHPPVDTLLAQAGGPRMWERNPNGKDTWFGVARVGVGMTSLTEGGAITFSEPDDMPTEIELEPATGKALQEFVRYQSVAYGTPALISLLVEPGYRITGERETSLGLMRAIIAQLVFSHGPDHLQLVVVTDDVDEWEWVKWLPHNGNPRQLDGAGPARMVYTSVTEFANSQFTDAVRRGGAFVPRHAASRDAVAPMPHTVVVSDIASGGWYSVMTSTGVQGWTFFDVRGGVPACQDERGARTLRLNESGVIDAVPRDGTWAADAEEGFQFFAIADQLDRYEAEQLAQLIARSRIAEPYEDIGDEVSDFKRPRDILSYYGVTDAAAIDFDALWGSRRDINSPENLRVPFGVRADNGELVFVDVKDMNQGGDGPHGLMSGTTGSGKTTAIRTLLLSAVLAHPPENLQMVLADCKGGAGVKPFEGTPHVPHIITDLEDDQVLMDRFVTAMWGEIARRKQVCSTVGADDAYEYNQIRAERAARGEYLEPLPRLWVVLDEFKEAFAIKPDLPLVLDQIGRQGRSLWVHMLLASQDIDARAEKLLENVGYRLVLRQNTSASASAAGVPQAVNLPREVGVGYMRTGSADELVRFRAESLWRDYRRPGADSDDVIEATSSSDTYLEPQLFTTSWVPLPEHLTEQVPAETTTVVESVEEDDEDDALRKPKIGPVILDQLRTYNFTPQVLWQPPLDVPHPIDQIVNMYLGRRWDENYGATPDLIFPIGIVDRPYKQDQHPLLVNTTADGANQLIVGVRSSGKTTALQTLICAAAMTHTPEQIQFYCLALSSRALDTVAGLPHVGGVAGALDEDGIRRTISEMLELLERRQRSFPACGISSMQDLRDRKFRGAPGAVPDDPYGDVYLVVDNYAALTAEASTIRNKDILSAQIQKLVGEGTSFGIHVIISVGRDIDLPPRMRGSWPQRVELKLQGPEDAKLLRGKLTDAVPSGKPGRGMVAQNYVRLGAEEEGLHTLIARPALSGTPTSEFRSDSVVEAVRRVAAKYRPAPPVRQLPTAVTLSELQARAEREKHVGMAWAVNERDQLVGLDKDSPFLVITGREKSGRTNALSAILREIGRVYAPGSSSAVPDPRDTRPRAQVWLISPRRELLRVLGKDYLERFTYRNDEMGPWAAELNRILSARLPEAGLDVDASLEQRWSGPEVFLIVDDADRLPPGYDAPLRELVPAANAAADVGLRVVYARRFGGWAGADRADPLLGAMKQANAPLLVMDSDTEEGYVRGRWRGHPMPVGRGFLMDTGESGLYVQVGHDSSPAGGGN